MGVDAIIGVRFQDSLPSVDIESLQYDLREAIGDHYLTIETNQYWLGENVHGFIIGGTCWRYYGPGYERGPWPTIAATLRWLRIRFPNGEVCYSGDSSDVCQPFSIEKENAMWEHWVAVGGQPYRMGFGSIGQIDHKCCGRLIMTNGGCGSDLYGSCLGCGKNYKRINGVVTDRE